MKTEIQIPDEFVFQCEIETPQFKGIQSDFVMQKQTGKFFKSQLKFVTLHKKGHDVQFSSIEDFKKALIKIL